MKDVDFKVSVLIEETQGGSKNDWIWEAVSVVKTHPNEQPIKAFVPETVPKEKIFDAGKLASLSLQAGVPFRIKSMDPKFLQNPRYLTKVGEAVNVEPLSDSDLSQLWNYDNHTLTLTNCGSPNQRLAIKLDQEGQVLIWKVGEAAQPIRFISDRI